MNPGSWKDEQVFLNRWEKAPYVTGCLSDLRFPEFVIRRARDLQFSLKRVSKTYFEAVCLTRTSFLLSLCIYWFEDVCW